MKWKCKKGHKWEATLDNIKRGTWCPECAKNIKLNMHVMQRIAKERRGKCLSTEYVNNNTKILWQCKEGHKWEAIYSNIKSGKWCPKCGILRKAEKQKLPGIKIAQKIAKRHGGKCLSTKYINNITKMKWKCKKGHKWDAILNNIKNSNHWCPECGRLSAAKNSNNSYVLYHWKTGEELICQASWEKAVVEYLNANKINFKWQHKTFKMPNGKTYRPDLYIIGRRKPWVEVKGYMREKNKVKWDWFQTIKPNSELWNKIKLRSMGVL